MQSAQESSKQYPIIPCAKQAMRLILLVFELTECLYWLCNFEERLRLICSVFAADFVQVASVRVPKNDLNQDLIFFSDNGNRWVFVTGDRQLSWTFPDSISIKWTRCLNKSTVSFIYYPMTVLTFEAFPNFDVDLVILMILLTS